MINTFLKQINDTEKRQFPIVYKYVQVVKQSYSVEDKETQSVFISSKKNAKSDCNDYHKPISKII